jgi:hypothetical protein
MNFFEHYLSLLEEAHNPRIAIEFFISRSRAQKAKVIGKELSDLTPEVLEEIILVEIKSGAVFSGDNTMSLKSFLDREDLRVIRKALSHHEDFKNILTHRQAFIDNLAERFGGKAFDFDVVLSLQNYGKLDDGKEAH